MCKTNIRNIYKRIKIGVIMETLEESCQSKIWHGISDCASKKNIDVILFLGTLQIGIFDREMHYDVINDFITINDLDGLIILSGAISHYYDINKIKAICDKQSSIPVVSLSLKIDGVKSVVINNKIGMEEIVDHLINIHNCKRIAFIKGPEGQDEADDRFEAYCTTLKKNNIPLEEELIIPGNFIEESGEEAVNKLIQECKVKFDAIVAIDDFTAIGAIAALKELGLRIPEDVLVTGFDDIDESNILSPPITTVKQPFYEQGQKSVELVLDMIKWDSVEDVTSLPTKLVIRQSCGCSVKEKVLIEEEELRKIYYKNKMKDYKTWKLQTVCEKLDNIIKFDTLMDVMYSEIPTLNIESCYLSLFKTKEYGISISDGNIPALSNLIMAYDGMLFKNYYSTPTYGTSFSFRNQSDARLVSIYNDASVNIGTAGYTGLPSATKMRVIDSNYPSLMISKNTSVTGDISIAAGDGMYSNLAVEDDFVVRSSSGSLVLTARSTDGDIEFGTGVWDGTTWSGDSEKMIITNAGKVGIGTSTPTSELEVNGKSRAKEIKVESTGWPDFVFSSDYNLKSLENIEVFINENGHLPNIESAEEIEENGVNVGAMQSKLLQKIEELTLYVIEQDKRIKQLESN